MREWWRGECFAAPKILASVLASVLWGLGFGSGVAISSTQDDLVLSASCDKQEVRCGDNVSVTITAVWEGSDGAKSIVSEANFPGLKNLQLVRSESYGDSNPGARGARFERRLLYLFVAQEPGEAETGPIEVKYYQPSVKGEKVASDDEKKDRAEPLVRTVPSIGLKVTPRATPAWVLALILGGTGLVVFLFAIRFLLA